MIRLTAVEMTGLVMLAVGLTFPVLAWRLRDDRSKPGVRWFLTALFGSFGWCLVNGVARLTTDATATEFLVGSGYFLFGVAIVGWVTTIFEFVAGKRVPVRIGAALLVVPAIEQGLLWSGPTRELVHGPDSFIDTAGMFNVDPGPVYLLVVAYYVALFFCTIGMLVPEWVRSEGSRRLQTSMLLGVSVVALAVGSFAVVDSWGGFHPFLVMFLLMNGMLAHALRRHRLFEVTTVGRETTVREMDDAMIVLDTENVVTDANPAARSLFGLTDEDLGVAVEAAFEEFPELASTLTHDALSDGERTLTIDGSERHFDMRVTNLTAGEWTRGTVIVMRDVTPLKEREKQLDLLKQVLTRVFRHNIRTEVLVIQSYAELLQGDADGDRREYLDEILQASDHLIDQSEKARYIQKVLDVDERCDRDVAALISEVAESTAKQYPEVTLSVDVPESAHATVHPEIEAAIQELLENAIEHAPDGNPWVRVWIDTDEDSVWLYVEDESGGLEQHEIEVLKQEAENPLEHGSGVGLWLVHWIVEGSGGELTAEQTSDGTVMSVRLDRPSERESAAALD